MRKPRCKCCAGGTERFAVLDSNRSGQDRFGRVFPESDEYFTYWQCSVCGFVFSMDLDQLTSAELGRRIYNEDYLRADPDFLEQRPRFFAALLDRLLGPVKERIRGLDFGGGTGLLGTLMCERGFPEYETYDPYFGGSSVPRGRYNLMTAFEVMEHSRDPLATVREMLSLLEPGGVVLLSTILLPKDADPSWWYIAPRNGHISIYSNRALRVLARRVGARCLSMDDGLHLLFVEAGWLPRWIARRQARTMLYWASTQDVVAMVATIRGLVRLGHVSPALNVRHVARLLAHSFRTT
jgi:hypothetical protein